MFSDKRVLVLAAVAALASAAPFRVEKRIAQTISDSTKAWVQACQTAGGADQCQTISQTAFMTLLAAGKNCDQQDAADSMIDLAKQLNNDPEMIRLAQIFVQQPRNAPDSLQVPYCQTAPKNAELNGLFHCEFAGSDFTKFSGDQTGNLPLGVDAVNPPGSCPAKPDGPVPDGEQLETLVTDPGVPTDGSGASAGNGGAGAGAGAANGTATGEGSGSTSGNVSGQGSGAANGTASGVGQGGPNVSTPGAGEGTGSANGSASGSVNGGGASNGTGAGIGAASSSVPVATATATSAPAGATSSASGTGTGTGGGSASGATGSGTAAGGDKPFTLQNGLDAQKGNADAANLAEGGACTDGQTVCAGEAVGQCVGGSIVTTACSGGTQCFVLPLVNKAGTSVACTTEADASSRIAATGATGGITGA